MKWTLSRDGRRRVTVRAEHRLSATDLAEILSYCAFSESWDLSGHYSTAYLEHAIRTTLARHGTGTWPYWQEHDYDGQAGAITAWARTQAARLGASADRPDQESP